MLSYDHHDWSVFMGISFVLLRKSAKAFPLDLEIGKIVNPSQW